MTTKTWTAIALILGLLVAAGIASQQGAPTAQEGIYNPESSAANYRREQEEAADDEGVVCVEPSTFSLPYSQTLNPNTVTYKTLPCEVSGTEPFLCNNRGLRYVPLPKFGQVEVLLVPMDCGDFPYRYMLVTLVQKQVVASQYVEGEWFEPGVETYKEITRFAIDANYTITVTTDSVENGKAALKETQRFQLQPDGTLTTL